MATRDYVSRGKKPRKTAPRRNTPLANNTSNNSWKILVAVASLVGFIFFLYQSSGKTVQEPIATKAAKSEIIEAEQPDKEYLPPKPEEKWSYIEELENKKVQVEANKQELSVRPYLMQCGAYKAEKYAEMRRANIAFQGLESQIKITETDDGVWYRVVLGPYDLKRKAESDRNILRRAGIEPCRIWYWED